MLNVLVVMIDCLRYDRFEGPHKTATTPNLDRFLKRSTIFEKVHAVGSNTTAVMGSWFTGLYPFRHGLRSFRDRKFTARPVTMAEMLRGNGYGTYATVTEALAAGEDILNGFEEVERRDKKKEAIHNGYGERCRFKLEQLNRSRRPWFYFIHTCELHPDRQCDPRFQSRRYGRDFFDRSLSSVDYHLGPIFDSVDWNNTVVVVFGDHGDNLLWEPSGEFTSKVMNRLRGDNRVSALSAVRDVFFKIGLYSRWKGVLRNNPLFHHDYHVYSFLTRAPLMVAAPGLAPDRRLDVPMSSVDALPTLFDYLGVPFAQPVDGVSLAPFLRGEEIAYPERALYQEVVTDFVMKGRDSSQLRIPLLRAIIRDDWKYVESTFDPRIQPELYNLRDDPLERHDRFRDRRSSGFIAGLAAHLNSLEASPVAGPIDLGASPPSLASA